MVDLKRVSGTGSGSFVGVDRLDASSLGQLTNCSVMFVGTVKLEVARRRHTRVRGTTSNNLPMLAATTAGPTGGVVSLSSVRTSVLGRCLSGKKHHGCHDVLGCIHIRVSGGLFSISRPRTMVGHTSSILCRVSPGGPRSRRLNFGAMTKCGAFLRRGNL